MNNSSLRPAEKSIEPQRLTFPHDRRLRSGLDFEKIYGLKQKMADGKLIIFAARNEIGSTRIGLSVSRRHGNSVVRHRLRRLLREAYRLEQHSIPEGLDLILIPGRDSGTATQQDYRDSIVRLTGRLVRKFFRTCES